MNNPKDDKKKEPGYLTGIWIGRILWLVIIMCMLAVGTALIASVVKLLIWYLALLF